MNASSPRPDSTNPCRAAVSVSGPLLFVMLLAALLCDVSPNIAGDDRAAGSVSALIESDDDEPIDLAPAANPEDESPFNVEYFDQIVFGGRGAGTEAAARDELEHYFRERIATLDFVCGLSDAQRQKLRLAASADLKGLFRRVDERRRLVPLVAAGQLGIGWEELRREAEILRDAVRGDPSATGSLFAKTRAKILTADQWERARRFATPDRISGIGLEERVGGGDDYREIRFPHSPFSDQEMAQVGSMTTLARLVVPETLVTDNGLAHLAELTSLEQLDLRHTRITGSGFAHLKKLRALRDLDLADTDFTDANVAHLPMLTGLRYLRLTGTPITNAGLVRLANVTRLRRLELADTQITDAALASLTRLSNLEVLDLRNTRVTDLRIEGLQPNSLKELVFLRTLNLSESRVTDAGLSKLPELPRLETLILDNTRVTDAGLAHLKKMPNLCALMLEDSQVTDAGLKHLHRLTTLRKIWLNQTRVTNAGVAALKAAVPELKVFR